MVGFEEAGEGGGWVIGWCGVRRGRRWRWDGHENGDDGWEKRAVEPA